MPFGALCPAVLCRNKDGFFVGMKQSGRIVLVTGGINAGKTTFCQYTVRVARQEGRYVAGLLSLGIWMDGQKVGVELENLTSGRRLPFAHCRETFSGPTFGRFSFSQSTIDEANRYLRALRALSLDLLVIDEIGPLECMQGEGLQAVWPLLAAQSYRTAIVAVRPRLVPVLRDRLGKMIKSVLYAGQVAPQQLWAQCRRWADLAGEER